MTHKTLRGPKGVPNFNRPIYLHMSTVNTIIKIGGQASTLPKANFLQINATMQGHHHFILKILLSDFDRFELADLKNIQGQDIEISYQGGIRFIRLRCFSRRH